MDITFKLHRGAIELQKPWQMTTKKSQTLNNKGNRKNNSLRSVETQNGV